MTRFIGLLGRRTIRGLLTAVVIMAVFLNAAQVRADGGVALSGSFYQQSFEIPQGSSISGPDVYVVVFNNGTDTLKVKMTTQAPTGVRLVLSKTDFSLPASGQQMILVGVEVGADAAPGEYDLVVSAEPYKETVTGIQLAGAASQKARLTVLGDSAKVSLQATSPDQQPMVAMVRLFRVTSGQEYEVAYSEKGSLEAKVAPGSFTAASYVGGIKLAEEKFSVAKGDTKKVILSGATVYFEGFDVVPNYQKDSGALAFVQVVYTVKNVYQRVQKGEVFLQVSRNGSALTELSLANLSPLDVGRVGLNYNYIPDGGWTGGNYTFKLRLNLDGKPYANSMEKQFKAGGNVSSGGGAGSMNPYLIGGIAAAVLALGVIAFFVVRKIRKA